MRRGYLLVVLSALSAFNFLDQQMTSILLEPIRREFSLTDIELGLLSGLVFAALYTVLSVPVGIWAVGHSRRNLIAAAAGVWGAMTIACGFVQSFPQLVLARLGVGIGEAGGVPPSQAWVSDLYQPGERATALAALAAGNNIGVFLAFLAGGFVGQHYGWRIAFAVAGLPPLLLALLLRFTVREAPVGAPGAAAETDSLALLRATLAFMWSDRASRQVLIGAILSMTVGYGAIAWIPSYLVRSHGLNIAQAGAYLAIVIGLGGALGSWLGGHLSDRLGRRDPRWSLWLVVIVFVAARPFAMAFYWVNDTTLALTLFVLPAAVGAIHIAPSVAVLHERIEPRLRPLVSALFLMILTLVGLGLGPLAVGAMSQYAFASYGEDSLRYALAIWQCVGLWAAVHYYFAGRLLTAGGAGTVSIIPARFA